MSIAISAVKRAPFFATSPYAQAAVSQAESRIADGRPRIAPITPLQARQRDRMMRVDSTSEARLRSWIAQQDLRTGALPRPVTAPVAPMTVLAQTAMPLRRLGISLVPEPRSRGSQNFSLFQQIHSFDEDMLAGPLTGRPRVLAATVKKAATAPARPTVAGRRRKAGKADLLMDLDSPSRVENENHLEDTTMTGVISIHHTVPVGAKLPAAQAAPSLPHQWFQQQERSRQTLLMRSLQR